MNAFAPGTLDLLVLRSLLAGPMHGYAIAIRIRSASDEFLVVEEGTLYPALHRMQRKEWLESVWGKTDSGRRARFYSVSQAGRKHLKAQTKHWQETNRAVAQVLGIDWS